MTNEQAYSYLAAFIDGEGHISCHITKRHQITKAIAFYNTEKELLDRVVAIANQIGLTFHVHKKTTSRKVGWSDGWCAYLVGGRTAIQLFADRIPIQSPKKQRALSEMLQSYKGQAELEALYASRRTSVLCHCLECGATFYAFPADLKRNQGKYCSVKCGAKQRRKGIEKNCETCGVAFYVGRARAQKARFCSQSCQGQLNADRLRALSKRAADVRWGRI